MIYDLKTGSAVAQRGKVEGLLDLHYDELTQDKNLMKLDPDWDKYKFLEDEGKLFTVLAYDESDTLVGYSVNVVDTTLHYQKLLLSSNDVIFIHPSHRGAKLGNALIDATEDAARKTGAHGHLWHSKPGTPLEMLLRAREYPVQDIIRLKKF